ncbi:hypothetical protein A9Q99_15405 [Gammaproteobacteria bacterium 45_16_T64]|nr:hypothetical protein A9Q99_15405 [Gammaproteobacteria bacterium 45_16_T64]
MIEKLGRLSENLYWLKPLVYISGVACLSLFFYALLMVGGKEQDALLIPSVLGTIWSMLFIALLSIFSNIPQKPVATDKFLRRIKIRFSRAMLYLVGLVFISVSFALVVLTFRFIKVWVSY